MMADVTDDATRTYRSPRRDAQARATRRRVLEAATVLFLANGFAGTTVRAVAARAGVSVATVELLFGAKPRLLKAAIDVAIAGDDEPVPVLDRAWADAALNVESAEEVLARAADVIAAAQARSSGLVLAVFEAARADPTLADLTTELTAQRQVTARWLVAALARHTAVGHDAVETLWVLMDPAVYDRLVRHLGWSRQRYREWFARSAGCLLLDRDPTRQEDRR